MMAKKRTAPKHVKDLKPDPKNARRHPERNVRMITESLQEVGAARSIVIDEHDVVLAGNGVLQGAPAAGITKVHVVEADGQTLIAVRRRGLTAEQKQRLALFDNRAAELAEWSPDVLRQLALDGVPLGDLFTSQELAALNQAADEAAEVEPLAVEQPVAVVWVLCAVPLAAWPNAQAAVETLQQHAEFQTMVMRPPETEKKKK